MANKLWIAALYFSAFVFAALGWGVGIWMWIQHEPMRHVLPGILWMSFLAWKSAALAFSRVRFGPKGPPPDPLENFHVDF